MKDQQFKRSIPVLFNLITNEDDPFKVIYYQNVISCLFAAPLLFLCAIINVIVVNYWHGNLYSALFDSIFFLLLAFVFVFLSIKKLDIYLFDHLISFALSILLAFIVIRYYNIIGPAVWTASFVMVVISLMRLKLTMIFYLAMTTLICGLYVTFILSGNSSPYSSIYILVQAVLFCIVFGLAIAASYLNFNRYDKAMQRLNAVILQKEQIAALFDKLTDSKEALAKKNYELEESHEEIKKNEERLHFLAYYDHLTELPNRKMILERLQLLINLSALEEHTFYVVFIDLDNFKKINDTMGHAFGDRYLQTIAKRLLDIVHTEDLLGRLGGDEFALIIQRNILKEEAFAYIENLRNQLCYDIKTSCSEFKVSASFGISIFPQDGKEPYELLKSADTSMYKAKELGKNNIQFYRTDMNEDILRKVEMESVLLKAYEHNEFFIEYQPQFNVVDHSVRGFEALIRWNSPQYGRVSPLSFIPLAEETGLIIGIGEWVLLTACYHFKELEDRFKQDVCISVNVSTIQMKDKHFMNVVRKVLHETGLNPQQLELEITESIFIDNIDETLDMFNELKSLGIRIALDDFGTGFSSLNYLRRFPIDTLKIDKSFINDLSNKDSSIRIVGDIISLGHNLDASIVAEGVENKTQLEYLKRANCDCIQGFLVGKPVGINDVENLLIRNATSVNHIVASSN